MTAAVLRWEEKRLLSRESMVSDMGVSSWFWTPMMSQWDVQGNPGAEDGLARSGPQLLPGPYDRGRPAGRVESPALPL
jgi:hypothetical protein